MASVREVGKRAGAGGISYAGRGLCQRWRSVSARVTLRRPSGRPVTDCVSGRGRHRGRDWRMIMGLHIGACPRFKGRMQVKLDRQQERRGATRTEQDESLL